MVFQNYALFPHLTVDANVAFPLEMRGVAEAEIDRRVAEALDLVQLPGYGERLPRQLSGGQQQRVALARAIVFKPRLLLLDEPLGALDRKLRETMQLEMRRLQRRLGLTTIYVTHDQEEALVLSDRIAVMNDGAIAAGRRARPRSTSGRPTASSPTSWARATSSTARCTDGRHRSRWTWAARLLIAPHCPGRHARRRADAARALRPGRQCASTAGDRGRLSRRLAQAPAACDGGSS